MSGIPDYTQKVKQRLQDSLPANLTVDRVWTENRKWKATVLYDGRELATCTIVPEKLQPIPKAEYVHNL